MSADRYPNVFYIGPAPQGMVFDPTHIALCRLADTRTFWVPDDRIDRLRSYVFQRRQRASATTGVANPTARARSSSLSSTISILLHNAFQRLDVSNLRKIGVQPDLILVVEAYRRIEGLEKFSCPKAFYVQDPHMGLKRYFDLAHVQDYDHVFVRQKDFIPELSEGGCRRVTWLPETFDPDTILGPTGQRDVTVTFIGHRNPGTERERMLSMLEKNFGAINPLAYLKEMASILRRSKIVFNNSKAGDLNNRVFDALGAGALLVTQRIQNGLFELFEDKIHLVSYSGIDELEEVVGYYLHHDDEREKIARTGQLEAATKHTNFDRAYTLLESCLEGSLLAAVRDRLQRLKRQVLADASVG